jgi:hypothetical protein
VARLQDEGAYLARNLPGHAAYRGTVRWRLLAGAWLSERRHVARPMHRRDFAVR